jgi:hypothetical protein
LFLTSGGLDVRHSRRPGYDVITDITQSKPGSPEVAKDIERVQTHFHKSGARQDLNLAAPPLS